jgi:hypothetical protein
VTRRIIQIMSGIRNSQKNKSFWCSCCCHLCPDNDNEFCPKKVRVCAERLVAGTLGDPPSHSAFCSLLGQNNLTIASLCQCAAPRPHRVHDLRVPSFASSIAQSFSLSCHHHHLLHLLLLVHVSSSSTSVV